MNLYEFLRSTLLFKEVESEILSLLAEKLTPATLAAHETLIREGDPGDSLYLLQAGKLDVYLQDQEGEEFLVSSLFPGDSVGEIALLTGAIRSATVRTAESSQLWQLTRQAFEQVAQENPSLRSAVEAAIAERLQRAQLRSALYENHLFKELDSSILPSLEHSLDLISLPSSEILFQAGEASDALYVVINGCLRIIPAPNQLAEQVIRKTENPPLEAGSGQIVGEIGIISGEPRTATIIAVRETLLGRLGAEEFYRLLQKHPQELLHFTSGRIAADYRNKTIRSENKRNSLNTVALFPVGPDVPLAAFVQQLTQALSRYGSALHIDDQLTNRALGESGIAHTPLTSAVDSRLALWFGEQEANHDYLIYASNAALSEVSTPSAPEHAATQDPWAERCAQQADRILYVAWADSEPVAVSLASESKTQRSLVLLHPPGREIPSGTQRWLDAIQPDWHHHIRWSTSELPARDSTVGEDMQRLARLLTGRGVGLVLSGGGARGYAHVGAIRALEEAGIPIDIVGGTSMGAVVAGLAALGHTADSMTEALIANLNHRKQLADLTLPLTSLVTGRKLEAIMMVLYEEADIVDAWRSFFCISTDITYAAEVVHRSGPMGRYVRASMSMPVVFPPQVDGEKLLIDGCLMNNYPANVMQESYGCGTVIGVNVCKEGDMFGKNQYGNSLSGWEILLRQFNPLAEPVSAPGALEILNRLLDLNTADRSEEQLRLTDIYIRPEVDAFEADDFDQYETIIEAGYRAAQAALNKEETS
ncbi:MAG: cyclic nucleotide-binding and patatin-like phospholipase domain-containing protein [Chloroflexota bacterium]